MLLCDQRTICIFDALLDNFVLYYVQDKLHNVVNVNASSESSCLTSWFQLESSADENISNRVLHVRGRGNCVLTLYAIVLLNYLAGALIVRSHGLCVLNASKPRSRNKVTRKKDVIGILND
jgi:hypothetical protein